MKAETFLPSDYIPAEDEPFMNERQTEYFRRKLNSWKSDLQEETERTLAESAGSCAQHSRHRRPRVRRDGPTRSSCAPGTVSAS